MFRALLRTIPNLSGNVKLACEVSDYIQYSDDVYVGVCRNGHLFPLASTAYEKKHNVSFLTGSWEYDVVKFYKVYSDIFYSDLWNKTDETVLHLTNKSNYNIIKDRNTDFEFGCRRLSYQKSGNILSFYAPFYCDNVDDLPDYFEIKIKFVLDKQASVEKSYIIPINSAIEVSNNYLTAYLERYFKNVSEDIITMKPSEKYSLYYGIDIKYGGFNKYKDNISSKLFNTQTTINEFDKCIAEGFKRNNLIMQQILPIAFYINPNDVLNDTELEIYKNAKMYISGAYFKNDVELEFYNFDDNYTTLYDKIKKFNKNTGEFENYSTGLNILTIPTGLQEGTIEQYKYENKISKEYIRWKLKYSDDELPYIINNSISFSKNQGSDYFYKTYPQRTQSTKLLCNVDSSNVNVLLPIGSNIEKYYGEYKWIVDTYERIYNDYITDWFDVTKHKDIDGIISETNWADVNSDGKVMFNGLLYNFNTLYLKYELPKIDKFAVLFYINNDNIITNENREKIVLTQSSLAYTTENGNVAGGLVINDNKHYRTDNMLYNVNGSYIKYLYDDNDYFVENTYGTGKFINITDLGVDYYSINGYKEVTTVNNSSQTITGFEVLPIHYLQNLSYDAVTNLINDSTVFFSYANSAATKYEFTYDTYKAMNTDANMDEYVFYKKRILLPNNITETSNIINDTNDFIYNPKYAVNDYTTVNEVFTYVGEYNKFYGNTVPSYSIEKDGDILYLDPYNIYENIDNFFILEGTFYINNIVKSKTSYAIELKDFHNDSTFILYITNEDYEEFYSSFEGDSTYIKLPEYKNNKFLLKKYIRRIYNIYKESETIKNNKAFIRINDKTYTIKNCGQPTITFEYHVIKKSIFSDNKNADLIDNTWLNASSITGSLYVSDVDVNTLTYTIKKWNYNDPNTNDVYELKFKLDSLLDFYNYGVKLGVVSIINNKFFINHTGVGTLYTGSSRLYKHPQNLIRSISNVQFLTETPELISKDTAIYNNIDIHIVDFDETDDTELVINNKYVDKRDIKLIQITSDFETVMAYGKLMNVDHLYIFKNYMLKSEDDKVRPLNYVYIKTTYIDNGILKYNFTTISEYDNKITLDDIHYKSNYLFTIDGYDDVFELYVKKEYIKVDEYIYNSLICLNTNNYHDLYIYRLERHTDILPQIKFKQKFNDEDIDFSNDRILYPVFNNVFVQNMIDTAIYQDYLLHYITSVTFNYNDSKTKTCYRWMKPDKLLLYDVSEYFTPENESWIYNKKRIETITTSYYRDENNESDNTEEIKVSYYSDHIKTYDDYSDFNMKYISVTKTDSDFADTNLNVYTKNGITYGFYLTEFNFTNITDLCKLSLLNNATINYFNKINGIDITNHDNLTDLFKTLIPSMNYNILSQLNSMSTLVLPFKSESEKRLLAYKNELMKIDTTNNKTISSSPTVRTAATRSQLSSINGINTDNKISKSSSKNTIKISKLTTNERIFNLTYTLYRYYDSISPVFIKGPNIQTEYAKKTTYISNLNDEPLYNYESNIYKYNGIRKYGLINTEKYGVTYQPEYKYFNDNKYINLETEFEIFISDNLTYDELLKQQDTSIIIEQFTKHINNGKKVKYNDDEILFLFNRYDVQYLSAPIKLKNDEKIYNLTYKFILK